MKPRNGAPGVIIFATVYACVCVCVCVCLLAQELYKFRRLFLFAQTKYLSYVFFLLSIFYYVRAVAQQDAEKAKYVVLGAQQEKKTIITRARGEAESAELIGLAVKKNPGFMKLRRIDAARDIADIVAKSGNKVYLNADSLLLNLLGDADEKFEKSVTSKWR